MPSWSFGAWSRRRVAIAASGLMASLVSFLSFPDTSAGKKRKNKKKKRRKCKKLRESCVDGGRRCCHGRTCGGDPANGTFCCQQGGESCSGNGDCCNLQCFQGACALN
jgi:hypothetical protein